MTHYDPFERGPLPVGVQTLAVEDASRERTLPVEFWYPAVDAHAGHDLDPERQDRFRTLPMAPESQQAAVRDAEPRTGQPALIIFSHGFGGERRQTTHFCTHLASHGYAVASVDHVGNTTGDLLQLMVSAQGSGEMPDPQETIQRFIVDRPLDASFLIDQLVAGRAPVAIDPERIGITGHSFGGWTSLATAGRDPRIRATLPLAPAGGASEFTAAGGQGNPIEQALPLEWDREVPTLYLVADLDTLLPLEGMRGLIARTPKPRRGVVLRNSDHLHFCDNVEQMHDMFKLMAPMMQSAAGARGVDASALSGLFAKMKPSSELCPGEHAYAMIRGLGLAHMDAHLREHAAAAELISGDLAALLGERGIDAEGID